MSKTILNTHIRGEAGVIKFANYCNNHQPYIIFREVLKSDFGIDGEIELTRVNEDRKTEPLGEILKVQIKTNGTDNSYIRNDKPSSFEFYPRKEDIEYWEKYKNNGIEVLLVIYDLKNDLLYAKKVIDTDLYIGKSSVKPGRKRAVGAITFHKIENLLSPGINDFVAKYSANFKSRINFGVHEQLMSNFLKYDRVPRQMYVYKTAFKTKKSIYDNVTQEEAPYFAIYGGLIYTFSPLDKTYRIFVEKVLDEGTPDVYTYQQILENITLRNHYVEVLNEYIRAFLWNKRLMYQRDYGRYYFRKPKEEDEFNVEVTTRKRGQSTQKAVVKKFEYGKLLFYRHIALECKHTFIGDNLYLILFPKYYFSKDGKEPLEPAVITKLTNFLTSREFNNHVCDWLHFWWSYLCGRNSEIVIYEDPAYKTIRQVQSNSFYNKHLRITIGKFVQLSVDFGIPLDIKPRKAATVSSEGTATQQNLFES